MWVLSTMFKVTDDILSKTGLEIQLLYANIANFSSFRPNFVVLNWRPYSTVLQFYFSNMMLFFEIYLWHINIVSLKFFML